MKRVRGCHHERSEGSAFGRRWRKQVLLLSLMSSACYQYHDVALTAVRPSAEVHVVLSAEASTSLARAIGPNASAIDGRVLSVGDRTMRLAATQIARVVGPEEFLRNEPIDVPASGALSISVRSFDAPRTIMAVAGILAAALAAHAVSNQAGIFNGRGGPPSSTK